MQISYSDTNFEQVYLVGVRLLADSDEPDFYTIVLYNEVARGDANRPLTVGGRILFSRTPDNAIESLGSGDPAFRKYSPFEGDVAYIYDLPLVLDTITNQDRDEAGVVADFIDELLDFVAATPWVLPSLYKQQLEDLANETTFEKEFGHFFADAPNRRAETCRALLWCIGAIASSAALSD